MKILFVLEYYYPHIGGVESLFKSLIDTLSAQGHQIIVLTNRYDDTLPKVEHFENLTIKRYKFYNRYLFTFLAWLPGLTLAKEVDLIHTTSYNAALPAWVIARLRGKKIVVTFHELWGDLWFELPWMSSFARRLHYSFERLLTYLKFDRFVAVSEFTKNKLISSGITEDRVIRIYNGVEYAHDLSKYRQIGSRQVFTFTYFGRIGYSKGLDILIGAVGEVAKIRQDFILQLIVPKEQMLDRVYDMIDDNNLKDRVIFHHELPKEELYRYIGQSDTVVIPSYSEGFCFAAVETMTIGTPILSSGQGALHEVVSGQHIEITTFDISGMAIALIKAIEGDWDYTEVNRFPLHKTVEAYIDLYHKLL